MEIPGQLLLKSKLGFSHFDDEEVLHVKEWHAATRAEISVVSYRLMTWQSIPGPCATTHHSRNIGRDGTEEVRMRMKEEIPERSLRGYTRGAKRPRVNPYSFHFAHSPGDERRVDEYGS